MALGPLTLTHSHSLTRSLSLAHSPSLTHTHHTHITHSQSHSLTCACTYTHTNSTTITPPSLSYFLFPCCFSMLSLSLEKLVTCGVIRSYNFSSGILSLCAVCLYCVPDFQGDTHQTNIALFCCLFLVLSLYIGLLLCMLHLCVLSVIQCIFSQSIPCRFLE